MSRKQTTVVVLLILVVLTGCGRLEQYPPQGAESNIYYDGSINAESDGLRMSGRFYVDSPSQPPITKFDNTVLYFFSESGEQLSAEPLGTFNSSIEIEISINSTPEYVILNSPDFWGNETVTVPYFVRKDSSYFAESAASRDALPVAPPATNSKNAA
jgi:hypothetical protein